MSSTAVFIAPLYRIQVSEQLGRGERLNDSVFITNDRDIVQELISSRHAREVGTLEYQNLLRVGLIAYRQFPDHELPRDDTQVTDQLAIELAKLHGFLGRLWLVKDNAASIENGFLITPTKVHSRIWTHVCTRADGTTTPTEFSREEFRVARDIHNVQTDEASNWTHADLEMVRGREIVEPESVPLSRVMYFVGAARGSVQLGVKIANYCSALEALLVTSPTELTYRLCQRVAWLLGDDPQSRRNLFEQLKTAYDFRCKAVHGSNVSARKFANDLIPSARICDAVLRKLIPRLMQDRVLLRYIDGTSRNCEEFESRLLAITLGEQFEL